MGFRWSWRVKIGSSNVTKVSMGWVGDIDNGEGNACVRTEGMWESSILFLEFSVYLKLPSKNKVLKIYFIYI